MPCVNTCLQLGLFLIRLDSLFLRSFPDPSMCWCHATKLCDVSQLCMKHKNRESDVSCLGRCRYLHTECILNWWNMFRMRGLYNDISYIVINIAIACIIIVHIFLAHCIQIYLYMHMYIYAYISNTIMPSSERAQCCMNTIRKVASTRCHNK